MAFKIALKEQEAEQEKQTKAVKEKQQDVGISENQMAKSLIKVKNNMVNSNSEYASEVEKIYNNTQKNIEQKAVEIWQLAAKSGADGANSLALAIRNYQSQVEFLDSRNSKLEDTVKRANELKAELMKAYNMDGGNSTGNDGSEEPVTPTSTEDGSKEKKYKVENAALEQAHAERLKIIKDNYAQEKLNEKEYYTSSLSEQLAYLNWKNQLAKEYGKDKVKSDEDMFKASNEAMDKSQKDAQLLIKQKYAEGKITQDQYNANKLASEKAYLEAKKTLYDLYNKDTTDIESQQSDVKIQENETAKQKKETEEQDNKDVENTVDKIDQEDIDQKQSESDDQTEKLAQNIQSQTDAEKLRIKNIQELHRQEMKMIDEKMAKYDKFTAGVGSAFESMFEVMATEYDSAEDKQEAYKNVVIENLKTVVNSTLDALKAQVLIAATEASAKLIGEHQWIGVAEGVAITALIEAAFGAVKGTVNGILGNLGSKKEGGFGETGPSDDQAVGVYHANEFIANADAVRNPSVREVLDVIDVAQKNGTINSINLPQVVSGQTGSKKSGGYANEDNNQANSIRWSGGNDEIIKKNIEVMQHLIDHGVNGVWDYQNYKKGKAKYESLESDVGISG